MLVAGTSATAPQANRTAAHARRFGEVCVEKPDIDVLSSGRLGRK
jgi:hypothetical protein